MTLQQVSKRIKTTTDLRGIVSTMKMLSSVSVPPFEKALASAKEYGQTLEDAFLALALNTGWEPPALSPAPAGKRRAVLIAIGSDNGLVGRFNREVLKAADRFLSEHGYDLNAVDTVCVGRRLALTDRRTRSATAVFATSNNIKELPALAAAILLKTDELTAGHKAEAVFLAYQEKSGTRIRPRVIQLMPLSRTWFDTLKKRKWGGRMQPMMSAPKTDLLTAFSREYLTIAVAGTLTASLAAEHYTRMLNMQQAEQNIDESLETLNLTYQQARQNAITDELTDIVSGAESLTKQSSKGRTPLLTKHRKKGKTPVIDSNRKEKI